MLVKGQINTDSKANKQGTQLWQNLALPYQTFLQETLIILKKKKLLYPIY